MTDGQKNTAFWLQSHPYVALMLFGIFFVAIVAVSTWRIRRRVKKGGSQTNLLFRLSVGFGILCALAVLSLLISYLRGK
jgi:phosphoglycerol transferase MdoB-like AlkP superfamily enzyme